MTTECAGERYKVDHAADLSLYFRLMTSVSNASDSRNIR